jgi:MFS family permease
MTLFAFAWDEKCVIFGTRFLTGFLQVFISVYAPVWIDTKGSEQWKTLQMSVLSMSSVVGDILGYILTALLSVFTTWRWSYMV